MPKNTGNRKQNYNRTYNGYNKYRQATGQSMKAYLADRAREGQLTKNYQMWKNNSKNFDYLGIDTPQNVFTYIRKNKKTGKAKYTYKYKRKYWKRR